MLRFRNIFERISSTARLNYRLLVETRRAKMIEEGYEVNNINWEHYARVLEAKHAAQRRL
jgi:coenzyme F420-reducing hydrogenase alpha subunit